MTQSASGKAQTRGARALRALRQRDWAGIAIEIVVVTIGVLLAFQVSEWAEDRRQRREERQFLERMWLETDEAIRENDWVIGLHAYNRRAILRGLAARGDAQALAGYGKGCGFDSLPGLGFNDTNYEELAASGRLNLVRDPDLRNTLRNVAASQADSVGQLNFARQRSLAVRQALEPYIRFDFDRNGRRTCAMNWPALVRDQRAVNALATGERMQVLMVWKRAYTRDLLAKAHNDIACRLGKPDCRPSVPQIVGQRNFTDVIPPALEPKLDLLADRWARTWIGAQ